MSLLVAISFWRAVAARQRARHVPASASDRYNASSFFLFDDDTVEDRSVCGQFPLTVGKAVGRKDMRDDVGITLGPEAARASDRHLAHCKCQQGADRLVAPAL